MLLNEETTDFTAEMCAWRDNRESSGDVETVSVAGCQSDYGLGGIPTGASRRGLIQWQGIIMNTYSRRRRLM